MAFSYSKPPLCNLLLICWKSIAERKKSRLTGFRSFSFLSVDRHLHSLKYDFFVCKKTEPFSEKFFPVLFITRKFYFGDLSAQPYKWDTNHTTVAKPTHYKNVKINIIDMGY